MEHKRNTRSEMLAACPPVENWPTVALSALEVEERELFQKKCNAVKMYVEGYPVADIQKATGVWRSMLGPLTLRCLEASSDGRIMGFRALLPYVHLKKYNRTAEVGHKFPEAQGGLSGVFRKTLDRFPDIEHKLIQIIKKERSRELTAHEKKIRAKNLHNLFLRYLKEKGVEKAHQWPFNTRYRGFRTIQKYLDERLDDEFDRTVSTREEKSARAHMAVGTGHDRLLVFEEPFDAVEIDAYSINAFLTVEFETPEGTSVDVQLERIWLIAMIETVSSAVLANSIVYRSEVSADDVLGVIRKAVNPPARVDLSIPGLVFPNDGGLPNEVFPQCAGAQWTATMLDGALANLSNAIHSRARKRLGFAVNWGPVGHFERRPNIERYFATISNEVFMRLPSTTGSNPSKGREEHAEQNSVKYRIRANEVEQLIAVFTAQHNATPTEGRSFNSPLDVLRHFVEKNADHFVVRQLPKQAGNSPIVIPVILSCTIRGGRSTGRRPYVEVDRARYTNPVLAEASGLIGKKLILEFDEEDWRYCKAYLENGAELGLLKAVGRWSQTKHSRKTRKAINSLVAKRIIVITKHDDPVQVFMTHLSTSSRKRNSSKPHLNPREATEANRVANESGLPKKITRDGETVRAREKSLVELQKTRPSMMSQAMPDLKQLLKKKRSMAE